MKRGLLFYITLAFASPAFSQASDFITVSKKNNRTVKTYFPGLPITLQTTSKTWVDGYITAIRNDSIFIKQYDIRTVPTIWGVTKLDTAGSYIIPLHYREIERVLFDKRGKPFSFVTNGTLMMIGGAGYALLNVVNGKYLHQSITDPVNMKSLGIALGVAATGFLLNRLSTYNYNHFGRKYHLDYIHMNDVKKQLKGF
jgi:hypothetical protein